MSYDYLLVPELDGDRWRASIRMEVGPYRLQEVSGDLEIQYPSHDRVKQLSRRLESGTPFPVTLMGQPMFMSLNSVSYEWSPGEGAVRADLAFYNRPDVIFRNSPDSEGNMTLALAMRHLQRLMGHLDFTSGCCSPVASVGACIDAEDLREIRKFIEGQ
jgi:hypothetical protein